MTLDQDGFELSPKLVDEPSIREIISEIEALDVSYSRAGLRNAEKKLPSIQKLVYSPQILEKAQTYLVGKPNLVRVIVFDKKADKNWLVSWHQDKTITVDRAADVDNWGPWTLKDGVHHVQPDIGVLKNMITLRVHLDPADESNGCLKVLPGTHKLGVLKQSEIKSQVDTSVVHNCVADAGDVLAMRPLILHASAKAETPSRRRVVHIEYSSYQLPKGLHWS